MIKLKGRTKKKEIKGDGKSDQEKSSTVGGEGQMTAGYLEAASPDYKGHCAVGNHVMCDMKNLPTSVTHGQTFKILMY